MFVRYYVDMAEQTPARHAIADAVAEAYAAAVESAGPRALVPEIVAVLARR